MDLDARYSARYSALCDALRAAGPALDALRREVVVAGEIAGLRYEGGAPRLRGDAVTLRTAWDALARDVAREHYDRTVRAGVASHREHAARERRWDAHATVVACAWDRAFQIEVRA